MWRGRAAGRGRKRRPQPPTRRLVGGRGPWRPRAGEVGSCRSLGPRGPRRLRAPGLRGPCPAGARTGSWDVCDFCLPAFTKGFAPLALSPPFPSQTRFFPCCLNDRMRTRGTPGTAPSGPAFSGQGFKPISSAGPATRPEPSPLRFLGVPRPPTPLPTLTRLFWDCLPGLSLTLQKAPSWKKKPQTYPIYLFNPTAI
ncbi:PREDICTED: uncharacterized protein LOC105579267 [Cercocebus atys]|uniref:uncharacterized protein LOC105579267 n=1 Tax=Cercocebus atys TaxID=9531 RepID=UPI0005F40AC9|nr:PREDICTED: uncharacterized protein LOC105579267 [Cercocebus atys]